MVNMSVVRLNDREKDILKLALTNLILKMNKQIPQITDSDGIIKCSLIHSDATTLLKKIHGNVSAELWYRRINA